jgi:hypothetical protein
MYLALFFMPWLLMYALSTIGMNHRAFFNQIYGGNTVAWEKEQEHLLPGVVVKDQDPRSAGLEILAQFGLNGGAYGVNRSPDGRLTILRDDPVMPRRITYTPADGKAVVEKQVFRAPAFLERLHRRRWQTTDVLSGVWGILVDVAIAAIVIWVLSGLWMWWEMKKTRLVGATAFLVGTGLFAFFLFRI